MEDNSIASELLSMLCICAYGSRSASQKLVRGSGPEPIKAIARGSFRETAAKVAYSSRHKST
jgi:hypothetical protein